MYRITDGGLVKPKTYKVEVGKRYFLGASCDPTLILVWKIDDRFIYYTTERSGEKILKIETWMGQDLIAQGMETIKRKIDAGVPFMEWHEEILKEAENAH